MSTETATKSFSFRSLKLPLLILGVTVAIIALLNATRPELEAVQAPEQVWNVDVIKAKYAEIQPSLNLFGEVVAGRRSELRPSVTGVMVEIGENFHDGGVVSKGELLVQIDPFDYETELAQQRSMLKESRVKLEMMRRDLDRAQELFTAKNVSEQFLDGAELDVLQQEAIVEQREIGVRRAERNLADTRLVAPFDGVVNSVNAALGKQSSDFGGEIVGELIDTSRVEVRFSLTNAQYGRLLASDEPIIGRQATVIWNVGEQSLTFASTIGRVGAEIASTTGGVDVFAQIDTQGQQSMLRPGAFVSVSLPDQRYKDVLQVPDTALYTDQSVLIVEEERLVERAINIVGYVGDTIIFRGAGEQKISDGDLIVTTKIRDGGPGSRVAIR